MPRVLPPPSSYAYGDCYCWVGGQTLEGHMPRVPPPPSSYACGDTIAGWEGHMPRVPPPVPTPVVMLLLGGGLGVEVAVNTRGQAALGEREGSLSPTSPQVVAAANGK